MPQAIDYLDKEDTSWYTTEDRRVSCRHESKLRVLCSLVTNDADSPIWTNQVRDLSAFGIGLILPKVPGLGQLLHVELARKNGTPVRTVLARVVHKSRVSSKSCDVGCAFMKELKEEQLRLFPVGSVPLLGPDCRRWTRYPCNVETAFYSGDTVPGERRSGRILDISAGGVGLVLRCKFSAGTLLHFELPQDTNLANPKILVRVVRVMPQGEGNWSLGCEFVDQLSQEQLRELLR
jgi:hypothetical protein